MDFEGKPRHIVFLILCFGLFGLLGAIFIEHYFDVLPCALCNWQRLCHLLIAILALGGLIFKSQMRLFFRLAAFALLCGALIALYQTGIEFHWWPNYLGCETTSLEAGADDFLKSLQDKPIVPCDRSSFQIFGLSLSVYNFVCSVLLLMIGGPSLIRGRKRKS